MSRPLIISDCDGVLLHFCQPFAAYLAEEHGMALRLESYALAGNLRDRHGALVPPSAFPALLDGFFRHHMLRQAPLPHAAQALSRLAETCDVVVLTNIADHLVETRTQALAALDMPYRVIGNKGPKGPPLAALLDDYRPSLAVFIDDIPDHHGSVAGLAPQVHRLHMVGEAELRHLVPEATHAHARIDHWADALPHLESLIGEFA